MEEKIEINVLGENFCFLSADASEDTNAIVRFFLSEIEEIENKIPKDTIGVTKLVKLLLATMNIANKVLETKDDFENEKAEIENKINSLLLKIENK